jgi:hypothetical protein
MFDVPAVGTPGERVVESVEQESVVAMRARYTTHPCTQCPDHFPSYDTSLVDRDRGSVQSEHMSEQIFNKNTFFRNISIITWNIWSWNECWLAGSQIDDPLTVRPKNNYSY